MTNLQPTVNDVLQIISDLRGETAINSDSNRVRAVSRANQDFARRKFWKFYRLDDQTQVGDGTKNYTIGSTTNPMRTKGLTELFVAKTSDTNKTQESMQYTIVDFNLYKALYNANNADQICYEWFDAANDVWKVHINPAPTGSDTITYSFYWEPPAKTLTTEEIICPDINILARMALAQIYEGEDEQDMANSMKQEAEQLISECVGKDNAPAVNQLITSPSGITNKGFGSY